MKNKHLIRKTVLATLISSVFMEGSFAQEPIFSFSTANYIATKDVSENLSDFSLLKQGSASFNFRISNRLIGTGTNTLFSLASPDKSQYIHFNVYRYSISGDYKDYYKYNIAFYTGKDEAEKVYSSGWVRKTNENINLTYTLDKLNNMIYIYADGKQVYQLKEGKTAHFLDEFNDLSQAKLLTNVTNNRSFQNTLFHLDIQTHDLITTAEQAVAKQSALKEAIATTEAIETQKREGLSAQHSTPEDLYTPGQNGAVSYRIPSLFTTQDGIVIAAADKRNQHYWDWGNIDTVIRRSLDGGKTWQNDQVIMDLATQPYAPSERANNSALLIDPSLVQDKQTGRIFMFIDMFPESSALAGMMSNNQASYESEGNGHVLVGDKYYPLLTDSEKNRYTLREDGIVYNIHGEKTNWRVVREGDPTKAFHDLGDIYTLDTNERLGNIYLNTSREGNDSGPLNAHYTSYLWMTYSDDDGQTWANPQDITTQVKADWMRFLGTGPGRGIQLKNGNLVVPIYYTNRNNQQSPALLISEDGGKTWKRGESPNDAYFAEMGGSRYLSSKESDKQLTESQVIELNNGDLKMFSRSYHGHVAISTSHDGGLTWDKEAKAVDNTLLDPYSQMSVIHYSKLIDGKEYVLFANPQGTSYKRENGVVWLGEVQNDGSIQWKYNTLIKVGSYSYNALTELPNGDIGLLFEERQGYNIQYVRFNLQDLLWRENLIYRDARNTNDDENDVSYSSPTQEIFYKIGDGEMIKVGKGINHADLVVKEGLATLAQEPDEQGNKQAYHQVTVNQAGTLRLADADQVALNHITLNQGTLDVYGNSLTLNEDTTQPETGLRSQAISGNILNSEGEATIHYGLNGVHILNGQLGSEKNESKLNFMYQPTIADSAFVFSGNSIINEIDVNNGSIIYLTNTQHSVNSMNVASNAQIIAQDNVTIDSHNIALAKDARLIFDVNGDAKSRFYTNLLTGEGDLIKQGEGTLTLSGELAHTGNTQVQAGDFVLENAKLTSTLTLGKNARLSGSGSILGRAIWQNGSQIGAGSTATPIDNQLRATETTFTPQTLTFTEVENQGGRVLLRVNNTAEDLKQWESDKVVINGDLTSTTTVPVSLEMLGNMEGKSDTNQNGQYDADEGLSLIQVKGQGSVGQFSLANIANTLYQYALVSFDKGLVGDYYDYQLHNKLVDENGNAVSNIVLAPTVKHNANNDEASDNNASLTEPSQETPAGSTMPNVTPNVAPSVSPTVRAAIAPRTASYLVSSIAMLNQGKSIVNAFLDNLWSADQKGFYVLQQHARNRYQSNLDFSHYGYDYKASSNSTLFGGYLPVSTHMELHLGLAFSQQNVTPEAKADGYSQTRYKTTSALLALHNHWENWLLNSHLGVHWHSGKVKDSQATLANITGHQYQIGSELGYMLKAGDLNFIPVIGVGYQWIDSKMNDYQGWQLSTTAHKVFSQHAGAYLGWESEKLALKVGAFFEHNHENRTPMQVKDSAMQTAFDLGKLDNAWLLKANFDAKLTPRLKLGLQLSHRNSVSNAKLKQTQVGGKLEYQF